MAAIDGLAGPPMATKSAMDGPAGPVVAGDHLRHDSTLTGKPRTEHHTLHHYQRLESLKLHLLPSLHGVDFTGALFVKEGNQEKKVYICLFTCATTRAVHLEVAGKPVT